MNVTESFMLQQIQQMAANMATTLPETGSGDKDQSFQDMMDQAGQDSLVTDTGKDTGTAKPSAQEKPSDNAAVQEKPKTQTTEKDAARNQEINGDPNAMQYAMNLFRPEIVDVSEEAVLVEEAPVELVAAVEAADVEAPAEQLVQTAPMEEAALPEVTPEVPEEVQAPVQQQQDAQPVQQDGVVQEAAQEIQRPQEVREDVQTAEAAPEETAEGTEAVEVKEAPQASGQEAEEESGDTQGEAAELSQQPVFRDVEAAPVKVAERYETVDTQSPDMDDHMAAAIRRAADDGAQRIQLTLNPANLGQVTVEMTRDASGVLQVALHVVSGKAEQLLGQHLDGLHAALAAYGQGQEVKVEVQRNQEAQQSDQHQANPDGHNQNQQQQRQDRQDRQADQTGDFLQKLRLGLFETEFL